MKLSKTERLVGNLAGAYLWRTKRSAPPYLSSARTGTGCEGNPHVDALRVGCTKFSYVSESRIRSSNRRLMHLTGRVLNSRVHPPNRIELGVSINGKILDRRSHHRVTMFQGCNLIIVRNVRGHRSQPWENGIASSPPPRRRRRNAGSVST